MVTCSGAERRASVIRISPTAISLGRSAGGWLLESGLISLNVPAQPLTRTSPTKAESRQAKRVQREEPKAEGQMFIEILS